MENCGHCYAEVISDGYSDLVHVNRDEEGYELDSFYMCNGLQRSQRGYWWEDSGRDDRVAVPHG